MQNVFYPCVYAADLEDGGYVVVVPGINVNAQGETAEQALTRAAEILKDVVSTLQDRGEDAPSPAHDVGEWFENQQRGVLQVVMSARATA